MKRGFRHALVLAAFGVAGGLGTGWVRAEMPTSGPDLATGSTKYGLFGWLDSRSTYGTSWFPEPLRIDEADIDNEIRFDYQYNRGPGTVDHGMKAELEKSFGIMTVELELPYDLSTEAISGGRHTQTLGFSNVNLGARAPFWQYVSPTGAFDTTAGVAFELGVPTNSPVSKNTELVPKVFTATRLGDHFSVQTICGVSYLLGSQPDGGKRTFEYGVVLGYTLDHDQLPLPSVQRLIPEVEFSGESGLDRANANTSNLSMTVGLRANLNAVGRFQPRLGAGYILPMDRGSRNELKDGFILSMVLEY